MKTHRLKSIKAALSLKSNWGFLLLGVLCLSLGNVGSGLGSVGALLAWLGWIPLSVALFRTMSLKQALCEGFVWGTLFHLWILHWLASLHPMMWMGFNWTGSVAVAHATWLATSALEGVYVSVIWAGLYCLMKLFFRAEPLALCFRTAPLKIGASSAPPPLKLEFIMLLRFVLMAVVWALGLYALHLLPIGVPVGFNVYSQAGLPWAMSSIRVLSFWGYESLFVFCGLAIAWGFLRQRRVMLACGLVVMAVPIVLGLTLPQSKNPLAGVPMITMTTLPSIEEIRRPGYDPDVWVRRFEAEFARKKQGWGLVILPEGTLPDQNTVFHGLSNEVLVAGAFIHDNGKTYNGVVIRQYRAGELRKQWLVRKRILVPFGETTPFIGDAPVQAILKPFHIDYETGLTAGLLNQPPIRVRLEAPDARLSRDVDVSVLICFEMFYPSLVGTRSADHVVLGVSNLGWFHGNAQFARIVKASWMLL